MLLNAVNFAKFCYGNNTQVCAIKKPSIYPKKQVQTVTRKKTDLDLADAIGICVISIVGALYVW